ncbi:MULTISPECIES: hypothetical protein [unclassified Caballeronia]|uniref:hypothetical protein n=1 Tax=unclassified Caballeronia TaxID=2646786 RepID=UPI00285E859F|nr:MULTISPECIES: hypothetical protein [unclassified Caballeronia]MDR5753006.1 hypothetical protein [Caballeronia sp. LZ024]MDR5845096.1 hypothetical protein [Caballeronia sp. LZ031]
MPNGTQIDLIAELAPHVTNLTNLGYKNLGQLESVFNSAPHALAAYLGLQD